MLHKFGSKVDIRVIIGSVTHRKQNDVGRFHRVLWRQQDAAVVEATVKVGARGAAHCEMPFKQVVLERPRPVVVRGRL